MEILGNTSKRSSPSPSPSPSPSSSPPSSPLPELLSLVRESDEFEDRCEYHRSLNNSFRIPMHELIEQDIIFLEEGRWKVDESAKESWDTGLMLPITRDSIMSVDDLESQNERDEVDKYLESAKKNNYFEAPEERPDVVDQGFYLIYPEGQDTIFRIYPNLKKYTAFVPKLGRVAVETHNFLTGSKLTFSKMVKAYMFLPPYNRYFFITLEAKDESGFSITCKSRVKCGEFDYLWPPCNELNDKAVSVDVTIVESFERLPK